MVIENTMIYVGYLKIICTIIGAERRDKGGAIFQIIQNIKFLAFSCDYTVWFVSNLVGNPEDQFSCITAQFSLYLFRVLI